MLGKRNNMKTKRFDVFETNSSSTHSIVIKGGEFARDWFPIIDGICCVHLKNKRYLNIYFYISKIVEDTNIAKIQLKQTQNF